MRGSLPVRPPASICCGIILGVASDDAHDHPAELMGITYRSKFVDGWYQQGRAAGEAPGARRQHGRGGLRGLTLIVGNVARKQEAVGSGEDVFQGHRAGGGRLAGDDTGRARPG